MHAERMTAAIRPRTDWEAVDLGLTLLQANARLVYAAWFAVAVPVALVSAAVTGFFDALWLAPAVFWWLKPLLDRAPLLVLSRRLFGQQDTLATVLRRFPGALRESGIVTGLTILRPGLLRAFNLPVWQLERLRGRERRARQRVLQYDTRGTAAWLTLLSILLVVVLGLSLYGTAQFFLPEAAAAAIDEALVDGPGRAPQNWVMALLFAFYVLAESVVEPLYVASGFTLYLNRRTRLEAWDIELAFRRLAARTRVRTAAAAVLVAIAVGLGSAVAPQPATATEAEALGATKPSETAGAATNFGNPAGVPSSADDRSPASRAIERVLARDDFQTVETRRMWARRDGPAETASEPESTALSGVGELLARLSEWLIWTLVAGLALAAWWTRNRWLPAVTAARRWPDAPAAPAASLEPETGSLPADIPGTALDLWERGKAGAALSLLYRGALDRVVRRNRLAIPAGATEAECIRSVASADLGAAADYFSRIARAWQRAAYSGHAPAAGQVAGLCAQWRDHFGEAP